MDTAPQTVVGSISAISLDGAACAGALGAQTGLTSPTPESYQSRVCPVARAQGRVTRSRVRNLPFPNLVWATTVPTRDAWAPDEAVGCSGGPKGADRTPPRIVAGSQPTVSLARSGRAARTVRRSVEVNCPGWR